MIAIRAPLLVCGLFAVYLPPSSGQYMENPKLFFKPMAEDAFDTRLRGSFGTPICVKLMMNCWEIMTGRSVCDEFDTQYFASPCTALRNSRCTDMFPFGQHGFPYQWMQLQEEVCGHPKTNPSAVGDS